LSFELLKSFFSAAVVVFASKIFSKLPKDADRHFSKKCRFLEKNKFYLIFIPLLYATEGELSVTKKKNILWNFSNFLFFGKFSGLLRATCQVNRTENVWNNFFGSHNWLSSWLFCTCIYNSNRLKDWKSTPQYWTNTIDHILIVSAIILKFSSSIST
jgi:hypothetical protein